MMRKILLALTAAGSVLTSQAQENPLKVYFAACADNRITPSSMTSEAFWKEIPRSSDFVRNAASNPKYERTFFQAFYNQEYLFFRVEAAEQFTGKLDFGQSPAKRDSEGVYRVSNIEFFFDTELSRKTYAQVILNINKGIYDSLSGGNITWNYDLKVEVVPGEKRWILYAAFPWRDRGMDNVNEFGMYPHTNPILGFNICRNHFADGRFSTQWAKTPDHSFHRPENFGLLVMSGETDCTKTLQKILAGEFGKNGIRLEGRIQNASGIYRLALEKALARGESNASMLPAPRKNEMLEEFKSIRAQMAKNPPESILAGLLEKCGVLNASIEKNTLKHLNKDLLDEI